MQIKILFLVDNGFCLYESYRVKKGEEININCTTANCNEDYSIGIATWFKFTQNIFYVLFYNNFNLIRCGKQMTEDCEITEHDYSKPYPECCNTICVVTKDKISWIERFFPWNFENSVKFHRKIMKTIKTYKEWLVKLITLIDFDAKNHWHEKFSCLKKTHETTAWSFFY